MKVKTGTLLLAVTHMKCLENDSPSMLCFFTKVQFYIIATFKLKFFFWSDIVTVRLYTAV